MINCENSENFDNKICFKKRLDTNCKKFNGKVDGDVCKIGRFRMSASDNILGFKSKYQDHKLMPPERFLELAPERGAPYRQKYIDELKDKIKNKEMDVTYLDVDVDSCHVLDHEGRHRAEASRQLGIKNIPVVIFKRQFDPEARGMFGTKGMHFDSSEKTKCLKLKPQIPM